MEPRTIIGWLLAVMVAIIGAWETRQWAQDQVQDAAIEQTRNRLIEIHENQARYGERLKSLERRTDYLVRSRMEELGMDDKRW